MLALRTPDFEDFMSIHFACEQCGHPVDVEDRFAGLSGHCKHCGHSMTVPDESPALHPNPNPHPNPPVGDGGFKLRPIAGDDVPVAHDRPHAPGPALQVRPLAPGSADHISTSHEPAKDVPIDRRPIEVLDPDHLLRDGSRREHFNPHYETRLARFAARVLRETRDRLYLLTIGLLVVALLGYLFKAKAVLHLATVGVMVTNAVMLVDGVLYLLVLPFQHSMAQGLGTLLVPPYTVYYWVKHWGRMKKPLVNTLRSFTPIFLVCLAYFFYEEAPVLLEKVEAADRAVEKALGVAPGTAPDPRSQPRQPSVADQAKQVLGQESNIIQELAKPQ